jgi:uncharacterized protein YbaP (TraB family)
MRKWLALACTLLVIPLVDGAAAQPAPPPDPAAPQWADIETVQASTRPGPAVWRVSKGDAEVWILATVGPLPKDFAWNTDYIGALLDGAHAVLTPPGIGVGLGDGVWLLINYGNRLSMPRGQALEATLEAPMRARFVALRTQLGQDEDRYRTDSPLRASLRLFSDFRNKAQLTGDAWGRIHKLADAKDVPMKPIAKGGDGYDAIRDLLTLPTDKQRVCLGLAVDDVDYLSGHAQAAARAWAIGDVRGVKANLDDGLDPMECISAAVSSLAAIRAKATAAEVAGIEAALNQQGKTIALIGMGDLLRKGGVLEQLEARHLTIEGPAE